MVVSALYASCLVGNLVEQLWNFAWPAAVAILHPSLLPVAVVGFFTKVYKLFNLFEFFKKVVMNFMILSFQSSLGLQWLANLWIIFLEFLHISV